MISGVRPSAATWPLSDSVFSLAAPILIRTPFSTRLGAAAVDVGGTTVALVAGTSSVVDYYSDA